MVLQGGCAGLWDHVLAVREEVRLPVLRTEDDLVVRDLGLLDLNRLFQTKLGAQLHGVLRTYLHTAAAGHAIGRIHLRNVVGADQAGRLGVPAGFQRHAGVPLAVANEEREVRAVDITELMHGAPSLGFQNDLFRLFAGDSAGLADADAALGVFAQIDAAVKL